MSNINMTEPFLDDLIPLYLENRQKDLARAREMLSADDFAGIAMLAHKVSGTAISYGFAELDRIVRELETAAHERSNSRVDSVLSQFQNFLSQPDRA